MTTAKLNCADCFHCRQRIPIKPLTGAFDWFQSTAWCRKNQFLDSNGKDKTFKIRNGKFRHLKAAEAAANCQYYEEA